MVDETLSLMLEKIKAPDSPPILKLVPGTLMIRNSVRGLQP